MSITMCSAAVVSQALEVEMHLAPGSLVQKARMGTQLKVAPIKFAKVQTAFAKVRARQIVPNLRIMKIRR